MFQTSLFDNQPSPEQPVPALDFPVLGVKFQGFLDPRINQVVFSQSGVARALKAAGTTLRRWLASESFKALNGGPSGRATLLTEVSTLPISVVTQTDLVSLIRIGAQNGNPVARSMQDASFATVLQQSVDQVLGTHRPTQEYLDKGTAVRQKAEYCHEYLRAYHSMEKATYEGKHGVTGLCMINATVSGLAVPDADKRRKVDKSWRKNCTPDEKVKLTVGTAVCEKAAIASNNRSTLKNNLGRATERINSINNILDQPFD
ncbi:MAG: hypothetical protein ACFB14_00225 [Leptolyngbyaceae cyanobacterium]